MKITLSNIKSFLEAYKNFFLLNINAKPEYFKEQVAYRMEVCKNDCMIAGKCKYCQCKVPDKMLSTKSCNNGLRFPDLMGEEQWNKFKDKNGIK